MFWNELVKFVLMDSLSIIYVLSEVIYLFMLKTPTLFPQISLPPWPFCELLEFVIGIFGISYNVASRRRSSENAVTVIQHNTFNTKENGFCYIFVYWV